MSEYIMKSTSNGWGEYVGELIRCKECKYYQRKYCVAWGDGSVAVACETEADGYCYLAERKSE